MEMKHTDQLEQRRTSPALGPPFSPRPVPTKSNPASPSSSHPSLPNGDIHLQPVLDIATSIPLRAFDSLPALSGTGVHSFLVEDDIKSFLERDLDLSRLNRIHDLLWMAGRPMRARPLHRYKMMGFEVLHTQQTGLHLLKLSNRLLLKPLSEYMLDLEFWQEHICERSRSTRVCLLVPVILHLAALFTLGFEACTRPFPCAVIYYLALVEGIRQGLPSAHRCECARPGQQTIPLWRSTLG
jgi:hypothetical protein